MRSAKAAPGQVDRHVRLLGRPWFSCHRWDLPSRAPAPIYRGASSDPPPAAVTEHTMTAPIRILLQTTIPPTADDWEIARFSLLREHLQGLRTADDEPLFEVDARDRTAPGQPDSAVVHAGYERLRRTVAVRRRYRRWPARGRLCRHFALPTARRRIAGDARPHGSRQFGLHARRGRPRSSFPHEESGKRSAAAMHRRCGHVDDPVAELSLRRER